MESVEFPETQCTACGYRFDTGTGIGHDAMVPEDGNLSVCFRCANVDVFTVEDGRIGIRAATPEEAARFAAHPEVQRVVDAVKVMHMDRRL